MSMYVSVFLDTCVYMYVYVYISISLYFNQIKYYHYDWGRRTMRAEIFDGEGVNAFWSDVYELDTEDWYLCIYIMHIWIYMYM
jgi:hypothetical protein